MEQTPLSGGYSKAWLGLFRFKMDAEQNTQRHTVPLPMFYKERSVQIPSSLKHGLHA